MLFCPSTEPSRSCSFAGVAPAEAEAPAAGGGRLFSTLRLSTASSFDSPKSVSLMWLSPEMRQLAGFRSRCITASGLRLCR